MGGAARAELSEEQALWLADRLWEEYGPRLAAGAARIVSRGEQQVAAVVLAHRSNWAFDHPQLLRFEMGDDCRCDVRRIEALAGLMDDKTAAHFRREAARGECVFFVLLVGRAVTIHGIPLASYVTAPTAPPGDLPN